MKRMYYAGKSRMGIDYEYTCPCWTAYGFSTKKERDEFVEKNEYRNGNRVMEAITRKAMLKIIGYKAHTSIEIGADPDDPAMYAYPIAD